MKWSDEQLVKRCLEKDGLAQKQLFDYYSKRMMGVCLRYSNDYEEAQDVLQMGFIKVFNKLGWPLCIVGTGSQEKSLKRAAKANIKFTGELTDDDLFDYYKACTALIMPQEEDFGLVSLEAQSFYKPVLAFGRGGALETVKQGKTGIFFDKQTEESLETISLCR